MSKKILLLSTWDNQGSGNYLYKISKFLLEAGYEVILAVRDKFQTDSFVIQVPITLRQKISRKLFLNFKGSVKTLKEYDFLNIDENFRLTTGDQILEALPFIPDLIITGLTSGFINSQTLAELEEKTKANIYMVTVDMSPLTGGCHYAWDCTGYQTDCRNCPAIIDESQKNKAHQNLMIKLKNVEKANIQVLAGSGWTLEQAKHSKLFKSQKVFYNINSCIDTRLFNKKHRKHAKRIFDLPEDAKIIFTGSAFTSAKRKGISYFIEALKCLWGWADEEMRRNTFIMIAGNHTAENELVQQIPFQTKQIDFIKDERLLSLAYQASDIFVCPSVEDAGPMMVSEALACGTPVVGFEMGVTSNMVINGFNGYKAELKNGKDLAKGIFEIFSLPKEKYEEYSRNAVYQVEEYSSIKTLTDVFGKILNQEIVN